VTSGGVFAFESFASKVRGGLKKSQFLIDAIYEPPHKENSFFAQLIPIACDCDEKVSDKKLFNGLKKRRLFLDTCALTEFININS
jgi:hypothetical protein